MRYLLSTMRGTRARPARRAVGGTQAPSGFLAASAARALHHRLDPRRVARGPRRPSRRRCRRCRRSRATSKPSPICAAMLASSWRSSARIGLFGALLAERDDADERAILRQDRDQQRRARALEPLLLLGRQPPRRRSRVVQEDLERLVRPPQHRHEAAVERQRLGAAVQDRHRRRAARPRCRSTRMAVISGCSASSIW